MSSKVERAGNRRSGCKNPAGARQLLKLPNEANFGAGRGRILALVADCRRPRRVVRIFLRGAGLRGCKDNPGRPPVIALARRSSNRHGRA
jgi:hypothetical protein